MKSSILISIITLLLGIATLGLGGYNVAATEKHWEITEKIIDWVRENSIEARAKHVDIPASFTDNRQIAIGAKHYAAMCTECHLTPGQQATDLALGLYPQAPVFHQRDTIIDNEEKQTQARKYFWVIKHGLKMTAMPSWGRTHNDETIWDITAFIQEISNMTAEQYAELITTYDGHHH